MNRNHFLTIIPLLICFIAAFASASPTVIDDFESIDGWVVAPSSGVEMSLSKVEGEDGRPGGALRVDFNFAKGSGFAVVRRELKLPLDENYQFSYSIRGEGRRNTLEFKLFDPSNDNVWWVNTRGFEFPKDWKRITHKKRHLSFAWSPSGGKPLEAVHAIELAITAGEGGSGYILLDSMLYEPLAPIDLNPGPVRISVSSSAADMKAPPVLTEAAVNWRPDSADQNPAFELLFDSIREFGGLTVKWGSRNYATAYTVDLRNAKGEWNEAKRITAGTGWWDDLVLPESEATGIRLRIESSTGGDGPLIEEIRLASTNYGQSLNNVFYDIAQRARPGQLPRAYSRERSNWTIIGVSGDTNEALLNEDGILEINKAAFSIEPYIIVGREVFTWAQGTSTPSLMDGWIPIPTLTRTVGENQLHITSFAHGEPGHSVLYSRYRVQNTSQAKWEGTLVLAVRPFQALPPWHDLNMTGGFAPMRTLAINGRTLDINNAHRIHQLQDPLFAGVASFETPDGLRLISNRSMVIDKAEQPDGLTTAAFQYAFNLTPGQYVDFWIASPFHPTAQHTIAPNAEAAAALLEETAEWWRNRLEGVSIKLPPEADRLTNSLRSTLAYILINRDGPAIQPGSRSYERTWIRDGAMTSTALLYFGLHEEVREFLDWFAEYQYEDGKIPCCVDSRGPDPVPEHDSHGQYIYGVWTYFAFTRDLDFLNHHWPRVLKAIEYIEFLRAQRMVEPYVSGPPEERAKYGLVPESISHEGYSAKPMHSYWDDFFILRGLKDAVHIATALNKDSEIVRLTRLRDDFATTLHDSIRLAMEVKGIDFIPGCVELGDFDATSTAVGLFPGGEITTLPQPELNNTFDRYWEFFTSRRDGRREWNDYTPYEMRVCSAFIMLGHSDRAHEMLDFFLKDQSPPGWNQWPEIVWKNPRESRFIGDMPHTWVASDFAKAIRNFIVYEREHDRSLVLLAGTPIEWLTSPEGISTRALATEYGPLTLTTKAAPSECTITIDGLHKIPDGGIAIVIPKEWRTTKPTINGEPAALNQASEIIVRSLPATVRIPH